MRADLTSAAGELLDELGAGVWPDPKATDLPDAQQASLLLRLLEMIKDVSNGFDPPRGQYNFLGEGIWEFKVTNLRLTFYDTDGQGGSATTDSERHYAFDGRTLHSLPDDFGSIVRLGHHFPKTSKRTLPADLECADIVRKEDLRHDQ